MCHIRSVGRNLVEGAIFAGHEIWAKLQSFKSTKLQFCPIVSGTSFLDQVKSLDSLNEIKFEGIAYPLLFLPHSPFS